MRFEEKLRREMVLKGFNQQRLARASGVSDSEVSRILAGKSQPGLENALKLARAVGVSLDYLADETQKADSNRQPSADPWAAEALELIRELGSREAMQLLLAVRTIGHEVALRRLFGLEGTVQPAAKPSPSAPQVRGAEELGTVEAIRVGDSPAGPRGEKLPRIAGER